MERRRSLFRAIPPRALAVIVASASAITVASLVFLWPTLTWLHPPTIHGNPHPAAYASYDVVAESASEAYVLLRPAGAPSSASLYRTQDAGATWHRVALPASASGNGFVLSRLPGDNLFLRIFGFVTGAQQFYVGDGSTWSQINVPDQGNGSLQMIDERIGFYVVNQTTGTPSLPELLIYRTLDGGRSWEQRLALTGDHANGGGLHLPDGNMFVTFSDATHAWVVVVPASWAIVCGATSSTDAVEQLLASEDGGASWRAISLPALPQGSTELGPPVFPGGGSAGFLTAIAHTFVRPCPPVGTTYAYGTLDEGATWNGPRALPGPYFDSPDGIVWWASDGRQVFRSTNQGQSWKTTKPKLPATAVTLVALFTVDAQTAWSLWSSGSDQAPGRQTLLRTTDTGIHWSEVRLP